MNLEDTLALRAAIMRDARTREHADAIIAGLLASVADMNDAEPAPEWAQESAPDELRAAYSEQPMTVAELRLRLRLTLEEIARWEDATVGRKAR